MDFFLKIIAKIGSLLLPAALILNPTPQPPLNPLPVANLSGNHSADPGLSSPSPSPSPSPSVSPTPSPTPKPTLKPTPKPTIKPSPKPSPMPPVTGQQLDNWFTGFANHYSIDREKLWRIAVCESGLNPNARNGDYGGLYQFSAATWRSTRAAMNLDANPELRFNPEEAIRTASFKISTVGLAAWPNCVK